MDESYTLIIAVDGTAALEAGTVYGALRGLETFSQLVVFNATTSGYAVASVPIAIRDSPRFPHRGFMVDTSRHYQTLAMLKRLIDSMVWIACTSPVDLDVATGPLGSSSPCGCCAIAAEMCSRCDPSPIACCFFVFVLVCSGAASGGCV